MTNKGSKKRNPDAVDIVCSDEADVHKEASKTFLKPSVLAAKSIKGYYKDQDLMDINVLIDELEGQADAVNKGDLGRPEAMLLSQAHTLDALFHEMVARFRVNSGEYFNAAEKYMKMALKAQSQCRTTLEALAEIKNPQPYIQNNKAQYQQVNNGMSESRAHGENLKPPNELLEDNTHEWMDTRAPQTTSGDDKEVETMGTQYRSED